jgi:hypothetical protein
MVKTSHVARRGEVTLTQLLSKNLKKTENTEGLRVDRRIILKCTLKEYGVDWIYMTDRY